MINQLELNLFKQSNDTAEVFRVFEEEEEEEFDERLD